SRAFFPLLHAIEHHREPLGVPNHPPEILGIVILEDAHSLPLLYGKSTALSDSLSIDRGRERLRPFAEPAADWIPSQRVGCRGWPGSLPSRSSSPSPSPASSPLPPVVRFRRPSRFTPQPSRTPLPLVKGARGK